jgi:acetylglutamate kinase
VSSPSAPKGLGAAEAVLKFLASVGPGSEAELYLREFRGRNPERFATLVVEPDTAERHATQVAEDVRFLGALGLFPTVVLGWQGASAAQHGALRDALTTAGVAIAELTLGPRSAAEITRATRAQIVPLCALPGASASERLEALSQLLIELGSEKLVLLRAEGGLWEQGQRISIVNLSTDLERVSGGVDATTRELLEACRTLVLERVPQRLLVGLTSPLDLLHELFTVKGAGTLLRKGVRIERRAGYEGVELLQLEALLESSFGKKVRPGFFDQAVERTYLEERYRGAAIVVRTELGGYLSKFAVTRVAQGEGIGQDLWNAVVSEHPALFWRARAENPIRSFYERTCQGRYQAGGLIIYFRGLAPAAVPLAIEHALAQPLDF